MRQTTGQPSHGVAGELLPKTWPVVVVGTVLDRCEKFAGAWGAGGLSFWVRVLWEHVGVCVWGGEGEGVRGGGGREEEGGEEEGAARLSCCCMFELVAPPRLHAALPLLGNVHLRNLGQQNGR